MKNEIRIKIDYPKTTYSLLNKNLVEQLNTVVQEFINYQKQLIQQDINYTLDIKEEQHSYKDYISYLFYITIYMGGAHPNKVVFTVNYDKRGNKIITVDDFVKADLLDHICKESRKQLQQNKAIMQNQQLMQMMLEGTNPDKNNFKNFIFTEEGLTIYFQQYQLAPYSSGIMQTTIPYHTFANRRI